MYLFKSRVRKSRDALKDFGQYWEKKKKKDPEKTSNVFIWIHFLMYKCLFFMKQDVENYKVIDILVKSW